MLEAESKVYVSMFAASQEMGMTNPPPRPLLGIAGPPLLDGLWGSHTRRQVLAGDRLPDPRSRSSQTMCWGPELGSPSGLGVFTLGSGR